MRAVCCRAQVPAPIALPTDAADLQELQQRSKATPSAACLAVSHALHRLDVAHACHVLRPDGSLLADILLPQHSTALQVEAPSGYVRNTGKRRGVQSAAVLLPAV